MNKYTKFILLAAFVLGMISCMGTNESDLAERFLPPQVTTTNAVISTSSTTVTLKGSYKQSSQYTMIDELGFYYGDKPDLTSADKIAAKENSEVFAIQVIPECFDKELFFKAYLSNGKSEIVSEVKAFRMPEFDYFVKLENPIVVSSTVSDVIVSSSVSTAEGITISEAGICYGNDTDISIEDTKVISAGTDAINVEIKGLTPRTKYYMRSYVLDREYIAYSDVVEFAPNSHPVLSTKEVSDISYTTSVSGGYSISDNGLEITAKGVVWSTHPNPTVDLPTKTENGKGIEDFVSNLHGLRPGTKYYVRSYAINSDGIGYGNELSFETLAQSSATVLTTPPTEITSNSVISGGNITSDGGAAVTGRGVVWSIEHTPSIDLKTKTTNGTGSGKYISTVTGLEPGTTYYMRAYAINSLGTSYGEEVSFTTQAVLPSVSTLDVLSITTASATVGGYVSATGGADVTERGVVWSTSPNPTIDHHKQQSNKGLGQFIVKLADLEIATTYYVRAYATNSVGTSYGEEISFTTGSAKPTVTTVSPSEVTSSSAVSGGNVTSDGGSAVTARGVVWSKDHNPTISLSTKTTNGTGTGSYVSSISGLEPGVTYYVRAYATNDNGTSYGDEVAFTSRAVKPTVTTYEATGISISSATVDGNVTDTGGAEVTDRGVVWSTSPNPTIEHNKIQSSNGLGRFTVKLTDLSIATRYYARAYAVNSEGVAYGNEISFFATSLEIYCMVSAVREDNTPQVQFIVYYDDVEYSDSDKVEFGYLVSRSQNNMIESADYADVNNYQIGDINYYHSSYPITLQFNTTYFAQAYIKDENRNIIIYSDPFPYTHSIPNVRLSEAQISNILYNQVNITSETKYDDAMPNGYMLPFGYHYNTITNCGIVWSTTPNPTVALQTKTDEGGILGSYTSVIKGLSPNTTYYARPYAINANGVVYGDQIMFTTKNQEGSTEGVGNEDFEWE